MMNELHAAKYRRDVERDSVPRFSASAVQAVIESSNRAGRRSGGNEARAIHALLRGRH